MKFDGSGSEQSGWRPGVVFQNNIGNVHSPNIIALPLTSCIKKSSQPTHVVLDADSTGLLRDSMVLCENPERMSKNRLGKYITSLSEGHMKEIAKANLIATSAISFMSIDDLVTTWKSTVKLNSTA